MNILLQQVLRFCLSPLCRSNARRGANVLVLLICLLPAFSSNAQSTSSQLNEIQQSQLILEQKAQQLLNSAKLSVRRDQFELALVSLTQAYEITAALTDSAISLEVLNELATIYYTSNRLDQAKRYYQELVSLYESGGNSIALSDALYNLAHVYGKQQQFDQADILFNRALALSRELNDREGTAYTLKALGETALRQSDLLPARDLMLASLDIFVELGQNALIASVLRNLGDIEAAVGNPDIAVAYYQEALPVLVMLDMDEALLLLYRGLSNGYAQLFDFQSAYIAQHTYTQLLQEQLTQASDAATERLLVEFETERFSSENKVLAMVSTNQRIVLMLSFGIIILALVMLVKMRIYSQKMRLQATTDELTGLLNRRAIMNFGAHQWQRSKRFNSQFSCLMLDIDHFKAINDNYGHAVGDKVLIAVAETLQSTLRTTDALGRFGGEEFLLLATETDLQHAEILAERIRAQVEAIEHEALGGKSITVSIGLAQITNELQLEDLIKHADDALYQAKDGGRNRVSVFMPELEWSLTQAQ